MVFNLSIKNSIASLIPIGLSILLSIHILDKSPLSTKSSSFLVPDFAISIAGYVLLSASLRSRTISELPVPVYSPRLDRRSLDAGISGLPVATPRLD